MFELLDELSVKCPIAGCPVVMGSPLQMENGEYVIRVRTSQENEGCGRLLLQAHNRGSHSCAHSTDTADHVSLHLD